MKGWLTTLIVAAIVLLFLTPWLGIGTGLAFTTILFTAAVLFLMKAWGPTAKFVSAIPFNPKTAMLAGIVILAFGMFSYGWFSSILPVGSMFGGASTIETEGATQTGEAFCSRIADGGDIADDIFGTSSSIVFNAYDMEANQPKSAPVDLQTNCEAFMDGRYVVTTADTASPSALSGFAVGKKLDVYCGGSTYYTDALTGVCIDAQTDDFELLTHTGATEANTDITCYDKTGATACTSGTTSEEDYTMALGSNQEDLIYVQVQNAVANKRKDICGMGVVKFYNITVVEPQSFTFNGATYSWSTSATPLHMQQVSVFVNESSAESISRDYVVYEVTPTLKMKNWEWVKIPVKVKTDASNNPADREGANQAQLNGFAILLKDCQWARGGDGNYHYEYYQVDSLQADVGINENETSPLGGTNGMVMEVS